MPKPTITELQLKVNHLEHKLREANPEPNMTEKIEARELECTSTIEMLIESCEKDTGRPYDFLDHFFVKTGQVHDSFCYKEKT